MVERDRGLRAGHGGPVGDPAETPGGAAPELEVEALRDEIEFLEDELRRREDSRLRQRSTLEARLAALAEQATRENARSASVRTQLAAREQEVGSIRLELGRLTRELARFEADAAHRSRVEQRQAEQISQLRAQLSDMAQMLNTVASGVRDVRGDVERISTSHAWRIGHKIVRALDRLRMRRRVTEGAVVRALERLRRLEQDLATLEVARATPAVLPTAVVQAAEHREAPALEAAEAAAGGEQPAGAELAARIRSTLGAAPQRAHWPRVSIVVLNRNGEGHLRRLIAGLTAYTDYPSFELIVVDNGSSDGSRDYLRKLSPSFALTLIENEENLSFSAGNGQGAARADGELLLFLNNDIEPFESGWMRELVAACLGDRVGAAGATLLHSDKLAVGVPLVQHRGIRFRFKLGRLRPYNAGDGGTLFDERFGVDADPPAVTGACLLVHKDLFEQLGGFPDGYRYGMEDVDLGLQIAAAGRAIVCSGRAHLLHRESSTQDAQGREFKRMNRLGNQKLFAERWGAALRREYRLGRLRGESYWAEEPGAHIGITLTSNDAVDGFGDWYTGHELGDALEQIGWRVSYLERKKDAWYVLPEGLDYLLVLLDSFDARNVPGDVTTIAWVRSWTERWLEQDWFSRFDLVLASSRRTAALVAERAGFAPINFPLATNPERFERVPVDPELTADVVFTGNYWAQPRDIQQLRAREGEVLRVFGKGWEGVPELAPYVNGPLPYERLPAAYSSAKVVVDDTALHTLPYGAVNSRVFDALACGTVVLTNCVEGVHELFDEEFPTWTDVASLRAKLDELLADDKGRGRLARRYRDIALERHTYANRARRLAATLEQAEGHLSFCIKTGANNRLVAQEWGDVHFGEALARQFRRRGHRAIVQVLDEWDDALGFEYDVVLHLKGLSAYTPKPGQFNVLWCLSHPDKLTVEECERYELVCVASERFASELAKRVKVPVCVLDQATDPRVFYPEENARYDHELVFVANSRKVMRRIMSDLLPTERRLAVYGTNWRGLIDDHYIAGEHVPNAELHKVYSSSAIVLNDHWDDMRERGFVSNRIYDALACGALVLSDDLAELSDRFGAAVVTYSDRTELKPLIDRLLASPEERAERGRRGRELVLAHHTFEHRVDQLLEILAESGCEPRRVKPLAGHATIEPGQGARRRKLGRSLSWRALTRADTERRPSTKAARRRG